MDMKRLKKLLDEDSGVVVDLMIKEATDILKSDMTSYKISKKTGISIQVIDDYRKGKYKVENMKLITFRKLLDAKYPIS